MSEPNVMSSRHTRHYGAPALDKGLDILGHLSKEMAPLSQLEIACSLERAPTGIYWMLDEQMGERLTGAVARFRQVAVEETWIDGESVPSPVAT